MKIRQGKVFTICHRHYGTFKAIALFGFDTKEDVYYPIAPLETISKGEKTFKAWEHMPCHRGGVSRIIID